MIRGQSNASNRNDSFGGRRGSRRGWLSIGEVLVLVVVHFGCDSKGVAQLADRGLSVNQNLIVLFDVGLCRDVSNQQLLEALQLFGHSLFAVGRKPCRGNTRNRGRDILWAREMEQIQAHVDVEGTLVQSTRPTKLIEDGLVLKVREGTRVTEYLDDRHLSRTYLNLNMSGAEPKHI